MSTDKHFQGKIIDRRYLAQDLWVIHVEGETALPFKAGQYATIGVESNGKLVERLMLPLSLSYDHRIVNGADAARFVVKLSAILSDCFQLLVEC